MKSQIRRFDHPARRANPYPDEPTPITGLRYESALILLRLKNAVQLREGEDADYLLGRSYTVQWCDASGEWRQIVVPAALITDLTSVPRPFRWLFGRVGPWLEAAIVHDYLYIAWQDVPGLEATETMRRWADDLMRAAMQEAQVSGFAVWAIHLAVRAFGRGYFNERDEKRYADLTYPVVLAQMPFLVPTTRPA